MQATLRFFAAAREAVGASEVTLELPAGATLTDALATLDPGASAVLDRCSLLVDGEASPDRSIRVPDGATVDVLPPFAGG